MAGQFYPAGPGSLSRQVSSFLTPPGKDPQAAVGAVLPHAGYVYSGAVAGETVSLINVPERVIILGPNHTGLGPAISVYSGRSWQMPFGEVLVDRTLAGSILESVSGAASDDLAHAREHSIEVQLPFLYYARGEEFSFVPVVLSHLDAETCRSVGRALAEAVRRSGEDILLVASSDMTHYESHTAASAKDSAAIEKIVELDPDGLIETVSSMRITMCGIIPTAVMLNAAIALGASSAELVRYTTSGEVSGDYDQVVGYAGVVVRK